MASVSELNIGQGSVEIEGTIKEIGELKTFNKFGRELSVADAIFDDGTGTIKLSLWNDDAKRFKEGDKIKIVNGYVNEFQGEKQLTAGKFGRIEKVEGEDGSSSEESAPVESGAGDGAGAEEPASEDVF